MAAPADRIGVLRDVDMFDTFVDRDGPARLGASTPPIATRLCAREREQAMPAISCVPTGATVADLAGVRPGHGTALLEAPIWCLLPRPSHSAAEPQRGQPARGTSFLGEPRLSAGSAASR
jgi:hypothetical protein